MRASSIVFGLWSVVAWTGTFVALSNPNACPEGQGCGSSATLLWLWIASAFVFALYRGVTRNKYTRPCPRCGTDVKKGVMQCKACGFDFRTIGSS